MSYVIRRAMQGDQGAITSIVRDAEINPFGLHWPRFLVAEEDNRIIGVVQVKPHYDGSRELASLAVIPERRGQGVGRALVEAILAGQAGPVYLTCADRLVGYYARFGFRSLEPAEMPAYFPRLSRLTRALGAILGAFHRHWRILVMARPA